MQSKGENARKVLAIQALALNYDKKMEPALLKMWLRLLVPYTAQQVEAGVERVMSEYVYKTIPPFAILKHAIDKSVPGYVGQMTIEAAAEAEWALLREKIARVGRYRSPQIADPTTVCVLRMMGGWDAACNWFTDEMPFRKKEFVGLYCHAREKEAEMALGSAAVYERARLDQAREMLFGKVESAAAISGAPLRLPSRGGL